MPISRISSLITSYLLVTNPNLGLSFFEVNQDHDSPPQQWAEQTFECADLGDKRRTKRLVQVAGDLSANTGSSLAASCSGNLAAIEGA
ncbi:transposase DNA-binding-containing protein, partial [Salinisphaera sp. G21_0]|uniref:IS4/Tn5 family transposase DNA-binding protein n=1 Tax=Salinisphaera sp. G21_0 TaxID=2821094 RepID=UPI002570755E